MSKHNTQRKANFNGGIKANEVAWDDESLKLDNYLKDAAKALKEDFPLLRMVSRMNKADKVKYVGDNCFGFAPDGAAWFLGDKLVAAFEAKKQGKGGNAYERWWDNASTAKYINEDVTYVTFCTGEAALPDGGLDKMRRKASIMLGEGFQFHMSPEGFTYKQVEKLMRNVLEQYND
jgi:hypothetical protein